MPPHSFVLLAEDNKLINNRFALAEQAGHRVDGVDNGLKRSMLLRHFDYMLFSLTFRCPELGGIEARSIFAPCHHPMRRYIVCN